LTEINHKVSVIAKWFRDVFAGVFAAKCARIAQTTEKHQHCQEPLMQEAIVGSWAQESHLSAAALGSLRDLNHRFLDLAAAGRSDWASTRGAKLSPGLAGQLAPLSAAQRAAAAGCPYALFDLRFQDDGHWGRRLRSAGEWRCAAEWRSAAEWRVADESAAADDTVSFVQLALFYAWHVASGAGLKAQLLLGMNGATATAFRGITVNQLPALVITEAVHLSARWGECTVFWSALTAAAARAEPGALRRVQLHGLQLAAAARLPHP
jgi:hypothetical protein